jgi:hypothetical protein
MSSSQYFVDLEENVNSSRNPMEVNNEMDEGEERVSFNFKGASTRISQYLQFAFTGQPAPPQQEDNSPRNPMEVNNEMDEGEERVSFNFEGASTRISQYLQFAFTGQPAPPQQEDNSPRNRSSSSNRYGGSGKYSNTPVETFRCGICLENQAKVDLFHIPNCEQIISHQFCRDCVSGYVKSQVSQAVTTVVCPGTAPKCAGELRVDDVREIVEEAKDEHLSTQFERFVGMAKSDNYRECPNIVSGDICGEACTTGSVLEPAIICSKCQFKYCFVHANAHPGEECAKYSERTLNENKVNEDFINETTKECPGCSAHTFKTGGCNHMTCQHCKMDWCWLCNNKMGDGNGFGVTEHYMELGPCAGGQFTWTPDGGDLQDNDELLLIYRCCGIQDPRTEIPNPFVRILYVWLNVILLATINILLVPFFFLFFVLGLVAGCCFCGVACVTFCVTGKNLFDDTEW